MRQLSILLPLVAFALLDNGIAAACVQSYGTTLAGEVVELQVRDLNDLFPATDSVRAEIRARAEEDRIRLLSAIGEDNSIENRNDLAVTLMRLGKPEEALALLHRIEREKPGLYQTAANIGTAYELAGRNDSALHWIGEGMRRDPSSHNGTEWLHMKILEAKIAMEREPGWLVENRIVESRTGLRDLPIHPGDSDNVDMLYTALRYQLSERVQFVAPPDPIVAQLLVELGSLQTLLSTLDEAIHSYDLAIAYGTPDSSFVRERRDLLAAMIERHRENGAAESNLLTPLSLGGIATALLSSLAMMFWLIRRHNKRRIVP